MRQPGKLLLLKGILNEYLEEVGVGEAKSLLGEGKSKGIGPEAGNVQVWTG